MCDYRCKVFEQFAPPSIRDSVEITMPPLLPDGTLYCGTLCCAIRNSVGLETSAVQFADKIVVTFTRAQNVQVLVGASQRLFCSSRKAESSRRCVCFNRYMAKHSPHEWTEP